ncbi:hypothetical protein [Xanthomonas oryzae]|uniref:hypothetical protein n=1 Tax=Xanthomonas oryzae TaxID=347 RepID=UPI0002DAA50E|nr:hypothetical protein [Xanthomonas oryzae]QBG84011.1 hypothetical protein EYR27_09055 [Xanthomonas oryzae]
MRRFFQQRNDAPKRVARNGQNFTTQLSRLAAQGLATLTHRLCRIRSTSCVDNPVGTGDFFTNSPANLAPVSATNFIHRLVKRDSTAVVENLHAAADSRIAEVPRRSVCW